MNELKSIFLWKCKNVRAIYSKQGNNFAAYKTLVVELGGRFNQIRFI